MLGTCGNQVGTGRAEFSTFRVGYPNETNTTLWHAVKVLSRNTLSDFCAKVPAKGCPLDIPKSGFLQLLKWEVNFQGRPPNALAMLATLMANLMAWSGGEA
jgi:hypothetical protein